VDRRPRRGRPPDTGAATGGPARQIGSPPRALNSAATNQKEPDMPSLLAAALAALLAAHAPSAPSGTAIERVAHLVADPEAQRLAAARGLQFVDVLWEDTGRFQGSSVGPNISDVTIEVVEGGSRRQALMPVLRFPNFADRTADVKLDKVWVRTGNHQDGAPEQVVTLRELLANPSRYLSLPRNGAIRGGTLLAPRDSHALVSAQAAFLPVPHGAAATFHPVIFNYQSTAGRPAVLSILVTRQGTSMTIVDNGRDQAGTGSWGQRLFFNAGGQRAPLTAERRSDVEAGGTTMNGEGAASLGEDANLLMLVQVPLRVERPHRSPGFATGAPAPMKSEARSAPMAAADDAMEQAVLGHGELEGPFTELAGLAIERDPRFPVRVTVQFYQATSSGQVTPAEIGRLAGLIDAVYTRGDFVGSLVVPAPRDPPRPTAWSGSGAPPRWWSACQFPGLAERLGVCCPPPHPPIGIH
jgi:hypothetical protein